MEGGHPRTRLRGSLADRPGYLLGPGWNHQHDRKLYLEVIKDKVANIKQYKSSSDVTVIAPIATGFALIIGFACWETFSK